MQTVSIFGCGWVGKALAKELEPNYKINCLVKSQSSLKSLDFKNCYLSQNKEFLNCHTLVIAIPPRGDYLDTLKSLLKKTKTSTFVILLSSTSIYQQTSGTLSEESSKNIDTPNLMLQAERLVKSISKNTTILRLGGLMGYNRVAGKYTQGSTKANDRYVNYIHRDDVVDIIKLIIAKKIESKTYNVVAPLHPKESQIYAKNAKKFNLQATNYKSSKIVGKIVSSNLLQKELNYQFLKPNPLEFWD
jgi:nucleoside-diphosphate-sugar epimerase